MLSGLYLHCSLTCDQVGIVVLKLMPKVYNNICNMIHVLIDNSVFHVFFLAFLEAKFLKN